MERAVDRRNNNRRRRERRRRRKAYHRRMLLLAMMMTLVACLGGKVWSSPETVKLREETVSEWDGDALRGLESSNAVLMDAESGKFLEGYNAEKKMYPASLTKIMTAVLAIEHTDNMEEAITLPAGFFQELYEENASMAGFEPGEQVRLKDLLYGITGYTPEAGLCLASLAEVSGREYILVTAGADGSHETEPYHILDAVEVYNRIGEMS